MKERLVGAAVLVILAVIFIPMFLDDGSTEETLITKSNIPPKPEKLPEVPPVNDEDFSSRIIPLQQAAEHEDTTQPAVESPADTSPGIENLSDENGNTGGEQAVSENTTTGEQAISDVGLSAWVVQLGSFSSKENADTLNNRLREEGYRSFVEPLKQDNSTVYRVRVGPELKRGDAETIKNRLNKSMEMNGIVVEYP